MKHYVYLTTNTITGKQYVGDRSYIGNPEEDLYLGSGRPYFLNALKKYGKKNFRKEILEICESKREAFYKQEKYINEYNTLVPNGYNISPKGGNGVRGCHSEETKRKISESNKGKKRTLETCENISKSKKGLVWSEESRIKLSESLNGHKVDKKTREKISKSHKGKSKEWLKGKFRSQEIKDRIKETKQKQDCSHSEETKKKISKSLKGKIPWNKGKKLK